MGFVFRRALAAALGALALGACATDYVARTAGVRRAYEAGACDRALELLAREESGHEVDRLLVLLDRGMILHAAGRWEESNAALAEAEKHAAHLDIVSLTEEAKVLLTNERQKAYRGEDFEKLLVNVLMALNYAALGEDEDALVEVRRVNERLQKMIGDEKKPYQQLAIARYLAAVLYEDQGDLDDAFIEYSKAVEVAHLSEPALLEPWVRLARQTGRDREYDAARAGHPTLAVEPLGKGEGQLVVVVEYGLAPEKYDKQREHLAQLIAVPAYRSREYPRALAEVRAAGRVASADRVTSVESVAQVHLNDRIGRILAKSAAGTAAKAGVAAGVGAATRSKELGWLTMLLLSAANKPDLRSWLSLPAEFQVARMRLPAGTHLVEISSGGRTEQRQAVVRPGRATVVVVRRF